MLHIDDYDFELPEALIALRPARPRPSSRMLVAQGAQITDSFVHELPHWLRAGDVLVFNDTRVLAAYLTGIRQRDTRDGTGRAEVSVNLLSQLGANRWQTLARPAKRLRAGDLITFSDDLQAKVVQRAGAEVELAFSLSGPALAEAIQSVGHMPLPPYIAGRRAADDADKDDYQTVFARNMGAVAAPTASLHFDTTLLAALAAKGIESTHVTLHVGAGTFLPVKVENIESHKMHSEWGQVSAAAAETITRAHAEGRRVIPVGTTAMRLIETAALSIGHVAPWQGDTSIFIRPGHRFLASSGLMTNFHLPRSTLMMLVAALIGLQQLREIYRHAIQNEYRFFSYGDSSLLFPE